MVGHRPSSFFPPKYITVVCVKLCCIMSVGIMCVSALLADIFQKLVLSFKYGFWILSLSCQACPGSPCIWKPGSRRGWGRYSHQPGVQTLESNTEVQIYCIVKQCLLLYRKTNGESAGTLEYPTIPLSVWEGPRLPLAPKGTYVKTMEAATPCSGPILRFY